MPFKSQAQRKFMYAKHPEMAAEWEEKTPKGKKVLLSFLSGDASNLDTRIQSPIRVRNSLRRSLKRARSNGQEESHPNSQDAWGVPSL